MHIPLNDLRDHLDQLDKDKQYLLLCQSGLRSYQGERILKHHGFSAKNIDGGYGLYESILPEEIKK